MVTPYQYDTRGASASSQIITLERMLQERDAEIERLCAANEAFSKRQEWWNAKMIEMESEVERLKSWIREEGERTDTCTYNVLKEVCNGCRCKRAETDRG